MTLRRLSRGTPFIVPAADIEQALASMTPETEADMAAVLNITLDEWNALTGPQRALHIVKAQNSAVAVSSMVQVIRTHKDLRKLADEARNGDLTADPDPETVTTTPVLRLTQETA